MLTIFNNQKFHFFSKSDYEFGEHIRREIPKNDILLTGPVNSYVTMLSGRQLFSGLDFWVRSYGIDNEQRNSIIKEIYSGSAQAEELLHTYNIRFLAITPQERSTLDINDAFLQKHFVMILQHNASYIFKRIN